MLRNDCDYIVKEAIGRVLPDEAVQCALDGRSFSHGRLILVAVGKAAWYMANSAHEILGNKIDEGIVITKRGHAKGPIGKLIIREAGHPIPDETSFSSCEEALRLTENLTEDDTVLFLLSGGGSALFESPVVEPSELQSITSALLGSGANIVEINTIRKRLSHVKGGRFARHCSPARVFSIVLSDVIGDRIDMIASGPAYPDSSTCEEALNIISKYNIKLSEAAFDCINSETPKKLSNVTTMVTGSVKELCLAAADACEALGYKTEILTDCIDCEASDAGRYLASIIKDHADTEKSLAFIAGGETVVHVKGNGKGGRNQELCLAAAEGIAGIEGAAVFSVGSDGTDGPTDAAGGFVDSKTADTLAALGISIDEALGNNDSYNALNACGGLIFTGATGTNVNDVAVALIKR